VADTKAVKKPDENKNATVHCAGGVLSFEGRKLLRVL